MKDSKTALALLTALMLGMSGPVLAKVSVGGGDGQQRAERTAKADRQSRKEQRRERKGEIRQSRREGRSERRAERDHRADSHHRKASWRSDRDRDNRWYYKDHGRDLYRHDYHRSDRPKHRYDRRWSDYRTFGKHRRFEDRVDRRLSNQYARTKNGWKNGEITRKELKRIRKNERKILRMDRRFGSDGRYTKHERRALNDAMDRASKRIYRSRHNDRVAKTHRSRVHRH